MLPDERNYVAESLELHLFFARIMKEHSLFLEAGFTPANKDLAARAGRCRQEFEELLRRAVCLSDGVAGQRVLSSGEVLTDFTAVAEGQTEGFTGIPIDRDITAMEARLRWGEDVSPDPALRRRVGQLNRTGLRLLGELIILKEGVLRQVLSCRVFTGNYPLLLEHIIREARMYEALLRNLEYGEAMSALPAGGTKAFWNRIMMEHALFMRGLLDPTEDELINTANTFAREYGELLTGAGEGEDAEALRRDSLGETLKLQEFKTAGVRGIESCRIRSVILPLLADHVLREANHYIRLLGEE